MEPFSEAAVAMIKRAPRYRGRKDNSEGPWYLQCDAAFTSKQNARTVELGVSTQIPDSTQGSFHQDFRRKRWRPGSMSIKRAVHEAVRMKPKRECRPQETGNVKNVGNLLRKATSSSIQERPQGL